MSKWHHVGEVDDFPSGQRRELVVAGQIVALFRVENEFFALDGICPHQGGPLGKGDLAGCIVTCPWHGFQFDVRDGQHQSSQQLQQPCFTVKIDGNDVFVELPE